MGAGAAVPKLTAEFLKLEKTVGDVGQKVDNLTAEVKLAEDSFSALARAMNKAQDDARAFASVFHSILDIQTAIADGYQQRAEYRGNQGANSPDYIKQVEASFTSIITQLRAVGGDKSAFAAIAENILRELQGGIITPDEALNALRGMLSGYEGGILQDIGNAPTMTARNLAAMLEAFIHGANLR